MMLDNVSGVGGWVRGILDSLHLFGRWGRWRLDQGLRLVRLIIRHDLAEVQPWDVDHRR